MKPFSTLTNEELLALTEEQIKDYVEYALAEAGLPIELESLEQPEPLTVEPDSHLTKVEIRDLALLPEVATQIQDILKNTVVYSIDYNGKLSSARKESDYDYPKFSSYRYESDKLKAEKEASRRLLKLQWEEYNKREEENREAMSLREEKLNEIFEHIQSVRNADYEKRTKLSAWEKYLKLANNDRVIAKNFFVERYSQTEYDSLFTEQD